jgi:hypothetical protein
MTVLKGGNPLIHISSQLNPARILDTVNLLPLFKKYLKRGL